MIAEKEQIYATVPLSGTFYTGLANSFLLPRKYLHGKVTDTSEKTVISLLISYTGTSFPSKPSAWPSQAALSPPALLNQRCSFPS